MTRLFVVFTKRVGTRKDNRRVRGRTNFITDAQPAAQGCVRQFTELRPGEGGSHALYNCCNTGRIVVAGNGDRIHGGIFYSHPAGRCCRHGAAQPNSREEISLEKEHEIRREGRGRRAVA